MTDKTRTTAVTFGPAGEGSQPVFSVNPGIALEDALAELSKLLICAKASAFEMCDSRAYDPGLVGATVHCIEGAKALVDALLVEGGSVLISS